MANINIFDVNSFNKAYERKGQYDQAIEINKAIDKAIVRSFHSHPMRHMTQDEQNRRFKICFGFVLTVVQNNEPVDFAIDHLYPALCCILDGKEITLEDRALWTVSDSGIAMQVPKDKFNAIEDINS